MNKVLFLIATLCILFYSCSEDITVDFTYSPEAPRSGKSVTFTNTTTGSSDDWKADSWSWNFGDDKTSTSESPVHTFKKAGIYTVKLKVNGSSRYTKSMKIAVYDSIPTIYSDADTIKFFQKINLKVLVYNPNYKTVTYNWEFSENAVSDSISNRTSKAATIPVFFNKLNAHEEIKLKITVGDSIYNVTKTFKVEDFKAQSLVMAQKGGSILRQRIFENGVEELTTLPVSAGAHPFNMSIDGNNLYVFDAGKTITSSTSATGTDGGSIRRVNMSDNTAAEIINNRATFSHNGFFGGTVSGGKVYWTDYSQFLYASPVATTIGDFQWAGSEDAQTAVPYYLAKVNRLGYFGNGMANDQFSGGIQLFDDAYYWAKGGTGRGIYRFLKTDILTSNVSGTGTPPSMGAILTSFAIRAFIIDQVNIKIYFSVTAPADKVGLWVSAMDGSNPQRIDDSPMDDPQQYITGIAIDYISNKVYWAYRSPELIGASAPSEGSWAAYYAKYPMHRTGIKMARLARTYQPAGTQEFFHLGVAAYGLVLDNTKR